MARSAVFHVLCVVVGLGIVSGVRGGAGVRLLR